MKITNLHNLPAPLFDEIERDEYHKSGTFSASEVPSPVQMRALKVRHKDEIVKDAADLLWILQGRSIHKLLEGGACSNDLREQELIRDIGDGITVSGSTDLYTGSVVDWKVTSVWAFILGGLKPEWEAQVNIYGWLWGGHGFDVDDLAIWAILRDWQASKALETNYPAIPFMRIPVPLWPDEQVEHYVRNRVGMHLLAEQLADDELPPCTPEEQWAREGSFAVKKRGQVKAVRVLASRAEADALARSTVNGYVEERPGKRARCEGYKVRLEGGGVRHVECCDARPFCHQYRAEHPEEEAPLLAGAGKAVAS